MDYSHFDQRGYPTLPVREGYSEWAATYESVVQDEMDIRLLMRVQTVKWSSAEGVLDLACGTGRIGAWLASQGARHIDGVDLTPAMLEQAKTKGVYQRLVQGDVSATGLPAASYDLSVQALADEHLKDLTPLYQEAARLVRPGGAFVIVGYHPHFLMSGVPTHFNRPSGESVAVESYVHLTSDHVKAAHRAGWALSEMDEGVVDDAWLAKKPKWKRFHHHPVSFAMVWRKQG